LLLLWIEYDTLNRAAHDFTFALPELLSRNKSKHQKRPGLTFSKGGRESFGTQLSMTRTRFAQSEEDMTGQGTKQKNKTSPIRTQGARHGNQKARTKQDNCKTRPKNFFLVSPWRKQYE
jgi:hypothetical protein